MKASIKKSIITAAILLASSQMLAGVSALASDPINGKAGKSKAAKSSNSELTLEAHEVHAVTLNQRADAADGVTIGLRGKALKNFKTEKEIGGERVIGIHSSADIQMGASNSFRDSKSLEVIGNATITEAVDLHQSKDAKVIFMPAAGVRYHSSASMAEGVKLQVGGVAQTKKATYSASLSPGTSFVNRMPSPDGRIDSGHEDFSGEIGIARNIGGRTSKSGLKIGGINMKLTAGAGQLSNMGNQEEKVRTTFEVLQSTRNGDGSTTTTTTILGSTRSPTQNTKTVKTDTTVNCGDSSITIKQIDDLLQAQRRSNKGVIEFANLEASMKVGQHLILSPGIELIHVAYTGKEKDLNDGYTDYARKDNALGVKIGASYSF